LTVKRLFCNNRSKDRGDVLIPGLWTKGTDCTLDVRMTYLDAKSNKSRKPDKVLAAHEQEKEYLEPCLKQGQHISPFVVLADSLFGKEVKIVLKRLALMLTEKWGKPYSEVCGYVNAQMSIAIACATHLCVRGSRIPTSQMSKRLSQWEDQAGLSLFHR
jgi:hypothetical protein